MNLKGEAVAELPEQTPDVEAGAGNEARAAQPGTKEVEPFEQGLRTI